MQVLDLARMADDCYTDANSTAMLGPWVRQDKPKKTENFFACAYKSSASLASVVVAFRGSDDWKDAVVEDLGGIGLSLNAFAMHLNEAIDYAAQWQMSARNLWLTGHSLGGAYVQLVGAILKVPGVSFNAPGVLNLLNQMSDNPVRALIGGIGGGVLDALTLGRVSWLNRAASGREAKAPIVNLRGEWDPVSKVGTHVGRRVETIPVPTLKPHPHSMLPLIAALGQRS